MTEQLSDFLIHWGIMSLSLWVASFIFSGLKFNGYRALFISALALGLVNASLRPLLFWLTLPLTLVTLGFFALALNALMIMLVAKIVDGFKLSGFWTAFFVAIFIAFFSFTIEQLMPSQGVELPPMKPTNSVFA